MKNKGLIIGLVAIIIILIGVVVFLLVRDNNEENVEATPTDAEKFAEEYPSMPDDNVFTYATVDEIIDVLDGGSGIVYLGFPECQWCNAYVPYLNDVAKSVGVNEILYYNIREDRSNNSENYQKIVELLDGYLTDDEEGNPRIYVPAVIFVNNGTIVGFDDETSLDTGGFTNPDDYWTEEEVSDLKSRLTSYMQSCTICIDCNS